MNDRIPDPAPVAHPPTGPTELPQPVEIPLDDRVSALPLRAQLVRFVVTGGLSAVVDFGLLTLLMAAGLGHTGAKALSFVAGTTTAYAINRRWTFRAEASTRRFGAIVALYTATFAVQVGLFSLCFTALTRAGFALFTVQLVSFVIAQGVATTVNFVVQRTLIFRLR